MSTIALFVLLQLAAGSSAPPELSYVFELEESPPAKLWIHASFEGSSSGETSIQVTEDWGGVRRGGEDLAELAVEGADGADLEFSRVSTNRLVVQHDPGERLTVHCAVTANDYQFQDDHYLARRPILNDGLFRGVGHFVLFRPSELDENVVGSVSFEWRGFEDAGWQVVSSWGSGETRRTVEASIEAISSALYLAGEFELLSRDIEGYPLTVTVAGDRWAFQPEEFADLCADIVRTERAFFDDFERDFYWISLVPTGSPQENGASIGGTGLSNCFSLSVTPNAGFREGDIGGRRLVHVLAHEMFHEWNGITIAREQPEELLYWFSEGFTEFYTRRLLYRGGFQDLSGYVDSVNETLELYATNPARGDRNETIVETFWTDEHAQKLPYQRGDIVAMLLDASIARQSEGEQSLDDVMRELLRIARDEDRLMSTELLWSTFSNYADKETIRRAREFIEKGGLPNLSEDELWPCLSVEPTKAYAFDVGFDFEASQSERIVKGVRDSGPAHAAGLRDGMTLRGWSVHGDDTSQEAVFQVEHEGEELEVRYLPRGESLPSYRVLPKRADLECSSL